MHFKSSLLLSSAVIIASIISVATVNAANEPVRMCTTYAVNFVKGDSTTIPEEVYLRHQQGSEAVDLDFTGAGICFQVPVTSPLEDLESFQKMSLLIKGQSSMMLKSGPRHIILFNAGYEFQSPESCQKNMLGHSQYLNELLAVSTTNEYQDGKYYLKLPSFDLTQVREIRKTADGRGLTAKVLGGGLTSNTYCYYSLTR